jgi:ribosomal protein S18 acetylase RimI-like enzyme
MDVCLAEKNDALQIAKIHKSEIEGGFLSSLKISFLQKFYEAIISFSGGFCVVCKEEGSVIGFMSGLTSINSFYRYFVSRYFFSMIFAFLPKIFNFDIIKKIFENIFYPKKTENLSQAELLTTAVKKEFQGQGIGSQILQKFILEMKNRQIKAFKVLVGKEMAAVNFYRKNGFKHLKEINLHGKEASIVLIYEIK